MLLVKSLVWTVFANLNWRGVGDTPLPIETITLILIPKS